MSLSIQAVAITKIPLEDKKGQSMIALSPNFTPNHPHKSC